MSEWSGIDWSIIDGTGGGLAKGWHDLAFEGYEWKDRPTSECPKGANLALKFQGAPMYLNFFPGHDAAGHQKATEISFGKLKNFFAACGIDNDDDMPDMTPEGIQQALDSYAASSILVGCYAKENNQGYMNSDRFRKAK